MDEKIKLIDQDNNSGRVASYAEKLTGVAGIELNKIYNEDCLETMRRMQRGSCDLVITSPPYNFDAGSHIGHKYNGKVKDNLSIDEYYNWQKQCIEEMIRVGKYVFYNIQLISGNKQALYRLIGSFEGVLKEIIIWDKTSAEPAMNEKVLNSQYEFILIFSEDPGRKFNTAYFNRGGLSNLWYVRKVHNWKDEIFVEHSAIFPLEIPGRIIKYFSKEGDTVYDPFMGMGSTAIACIKSNRNYIGSEIVKEYCELAEKRIKPHRDQINLFNSQGEA